MRASHLIGMGVDGHGADERGASGQGADERRAHGYGASRYGTTCYGSGGHGVVSRSRDGSYGTASGPRGAGSNRAVSDRGRRPEDDAEPRPEDTAQPWVVVTARPGETAPREPWKFWDTVDQYVREGILTKGEAHIIKSAAAAGILRS